MLQLCRPAAEKPEVVKKTVRIWTLIKQLNSDPFKIEKQDPYPYQSEKQDPDPQH